MYHPGLITDRQLAQIRYQEILQEAAEARADRKAQTAHSPAPPVARKLSFALVAAAGVLWIVWTFITGQSRIVK